MGTKDLQRLDLVATPPELARRQHFLQSLVPYYGLGFRKTVLEPTLFARIMDHYLENLDRFHPEVEDGFILNEDPLRLPSLLFEDKDFNRRLLRELHPAHEAWAGMPLREANCYGIRVYQRGSYLYGHVDNPLTHHISATICVDHRLDRPWPLHLVDIEGRAHQVSLEPGEMLFFEGARLEHGRPFPLDGDYFANLYVHYTPLDWQAPAELQDGGAHLPPPPARP